MMWIAGVLGGLGLACMVYRRTLLGLLIGLQLLVLGSTLIFVLAGVSSGLPEEGYIAAFFVLLGGMAQLVVGYALAIRLFFLKKNVSMNELRNLKQ